MSDPSRLGRRLRPSFDDRPGTLNIAAQRVDGQWALLLWWEASLPEKVLGHKGRERRWSRLSSALDFATRRYPSVCSFQLFWPPRWLPAKARSSRNRMARSSSTAALLSPHRSGSRTAQSRNPRR